MNISRDELIGYMVNDLGLDADDIDDDTLLFTDGLLDSFNMVDLISFIEKNLGSKIAVTDVILDNFDSVGRILDFIRKKSE